MYPPNSSQVDDFSSDSDRPDSPDEFPDHLNEVESNVIFDALMNNGNVSRCCNTVLSSH